jgi:hypothetical protein
MSKYGIITSVIIIPSRKTKQQIVEVGQKLGIRNEWCMVQFLVLNPWSSKRIQAKS